MSLKTFLKKEQTKTKIIAIHHPIHSKSREGFFAKTGGLSIDDFQNKQYRTLRNRLLTVARQHESVLFVSGHDKNLQFINERGVPQVISGAAGTINKLRAVSKETGNFTHNENGFARLDIYDDGSLKVGFNVNSKTIFTKVLFNTTKKKVSFKFKPRDSFKSTQKASIYTKEETKKSGFYRSLWGEHYREYYGKLVDAPVVFLDTLWGGLVPLKRGGGQQSKSLRLQDKDGKQFVMRALRKSTTKFFTSQCFSRNIHRKCIGWIRYR